MRRAQQRTIYDELRIDVGRDGAIKSPSPQSEKPIIASSVYAGMDTSGIGQADTTSRDTDTYTGGAVTPFDYMTPPAGVEDRLADAGKINNTRQANPSRGITPSSSPLMRRA